MKTIEIKQKQITETIERCSLMTEYINKAIELLKDKVQEPITTELIYKIVYSSYIQLEQEKQFNEITNTLGLTNELLIELPYDMKQLYGRMAYNKVEYLYKVKELLYHFNSFYLAFITITDNKASVKPLNEITEYFTIKTSNKKQEEITTSLETICKELDKLSKHKIDCYLINHILYHHNGKHNILSDYIKGNF